MKRYRVTVDGHTYTVEVEDPRARPVVARVEGATFVVDVESGDPLPAPAPPVPPAAFAPPARLVPLADVMTAPIPGTVMKIAVTAGKVVQRGDEILTIEAMKMFNLIRSPRAGTVATVHVAERARVSEGDPLVTFVS